MIEKSIEAILTVDKQARQKEAQVEQQRRRVEDTVAQRRRDLQTAYERGVAEAVSYTKEEQARRLSAGKAAIDARQTELLAAMAARVDSMHDTWVAELAARVTEQE